MHRFRSSSTIYRFTIAAALLLLGYPLALATLLLLGYSLLHNNRELTILVTLLGGLTLSIFTVQWVIARRTQCPLCMTPVLATKHCAKHRKACKLLGNYRLYAAFAVVFRGKFTCPYCNERSELKLRESRREIPLEKHRSQRR